MIGPAALLLAAAAPGPGTFPRAPRPGPSPPPPAQRSVQSPPSPARVFYVEMGADSGGQNLSLRCDPGRGRPVLLKRFDRSVDIGWSPLGTRFLVNDYIGSNLADCLVVRPAGGGVRGISLRRAIRRSPGRPRAPETPWDSHYYVHCYRWLSDTIIAGVVAGHTDEPASGPNHPHAFEHAFRFDAATGRISWRGSRRWDPNRENPP